MGGPPPDKKSNRKPLVLLGVGALAVIALVAVLLASGSKNASAGEIILEPIDSAGQSPFLAGKLNDALSKLKMPQVSIPGLPILGGAIGRRDASGVDEHHVDDDDHDDHPAPTTTAGAIAIPSVRGNAPGLYGGTGDQSACDVQQLVDFLRTNADKAKRMGRRARHRRR